jgi:serine/alanine adding enzyme
MEHPKGNVFHTPEYFDLCNSISLYNGTAICCMSGEKICGMLIAVVQHDFPSFLGALTARSVIWGGPLTENNNEEIVSLLLEAYNNKVKRNVLFSQFRNLSDISLWTKTFETAGYKFEEHLNILIDLSRDKEQLWSDIHPTRRKQINRSAKREVMTSIPEKIDNDKLRKCFDLLQKVYRKTGLPLPGYYYFENAVKIFDKKGILKLFLAEYNNEIIGFRMVLCFKRTIYDWYAAGSEDHLDKYPNDVLPWEVLKWGYKNDFMSFDFGGAGKPSQEYGVRDYKLKFGGQVVNWGRFTLIHKKSTYAIIMTLFRLWKKFIVKR